MEHAKTHRLRHGRHSEPNRIYLITTQTHNRLPVFSDFSAARELIHVLKNAQHLKQAETLAFVVMPDHLHWLMQLGIQSSLSKTVQSVKSYSARRLGINPLWQAGFHDHALRHEDDVINIALHRHEPCTSGHHQQHHKLPTLGCRVVIAGYFQERTSDREGSLTA